MNINNAERPSLFLANLAQGLRQSGEYDEVSVSTNQEGHREIRQFEEKGFFQKMKNVISCIFHQVAALFTGGPIERSEEARDVEDTLDSMKFMFGERRVERCLRKLQIDPNSLSSWNCRFTKHDLIALFNSFAILTQDDFEDLLGEINSNHQDVRGIMGEDLEELRRTFHGKVTIHDCSTADLDKLELILLPFRAPGDQFVQYAPETWDQFQFPPSPRDNMEEAAWGSYLITHHNLPVEDWEVEFAKKVPHLTHPEGLMVRHPKGWLSLTNHLESHGASKLFFRSLNPQELQSIVAYRGTRIPYKTGSLRDGLTSIAEDLTNQIGTNSVEKTYDMTREILENPNFGFIHHPEEKVQFIGYSLGGTQAQRDTVLFANRVSKLTTVCAPCVDHRTCQYFRENVGRMRRNCEDALKIEMFTEEGDMVDQVGEEHLGAHCERTELSCRRVVPLTAENIAHPVETVADGHWPAPQRDLSLCERVRIAYNNLFGQGGHNRETVPYSYISFQAKAPPSSFNVNDDEAERERILAGEIATHALAGNDWEWWRRFFSLFAAERDFTEFARERTRFL